MLNIKYRNQVILLVGWILIVIVLFRLVTDKQMASLFAGAGFIILPILFLLSEFKGRRSKVHIATLAFFLVFSALPIFLLRIFNWGTEFNSIYFLGFSAEFLHRTSNIIYLIVLSSATYHWRAKQ